MKYSKIIVRGLHFLTAKIMNQRIPVQVHIRLLEQCNKNCSYCKGDYPVNNQESAATSEFLKVIDGFVGLGAKRFTLFGGEPLLYDGIEAIVDRIKYHKVNCSIITNGSLIGQHKALLEKIDLLSVSLDGDRNCHDAYRGEGSYNQAIHAIELARSKGVPVQLLCTITRLTDPKLPYLAKIADYYNCTIDLEQLNPLFNPDGTVTLRQEDPGLDKINSLIDYQLKHRNLRMVNSAYVLRYVRRWPLGYNVFRLFKDQIPANTRLIKCYGGKFSAVVEANGDLLPCCLIRPDYRPVNVFKLGVRKAWRIMPANNCIACRSIGYNMFNSLFSLNVNSLIHLLGREKINKFC